MYPHPPECSRSRRKSIPVDDKLAALNKPNQGKKGSPKHSDNKKKEDASPLSPLKSAPDLYRKSNQNLATNTNRNRTNANGSDGNFGIIRSNNNECLVERSLSFSKYKPLPAINDKKEEDNDKMSNKKRTFESWSTQNQNADVNQEKDDFLLDTIKKMRLGNDAFDEDCNIQNVDVTKQLVDINKSKETYKDDNIPSSSSSIDLIIRLPDGKRVQNSFSSSDTLGSVVEYLSKKMKKKIDLKMYVLYINEVPKRELKNRKSTIVALGIHDKSVLVLDTRDSPGKK